MMVIDVQNLCKSFLFYGFDPHGSLKEAFIRCVKGLFGKKDPLTIRKSQRRLVLDHVSFKIEKGETVALLGKNGSGKSTLLKLMAGIYQADSGSIDITGSVSSLIELGAGFHPEFSGAENVIINGQILGFSKKQMLEKYDEIIAFSGIESHIHMPVRTYSSGMFLRLAFSVAINVNPDILFIDEIIAVGDEDFQIKCQKKMAEIKSKGKTIIMVTHNLEDVKKWADRVIYLKEGRIAFDGHTAEGLKLYLNHHPEDTL